MALRAECLYTPTERDGPGDPGYQLHSAELSFRHPRSGHALVIECEPPEQLRPLQKLR